MSLAPYDTIKSAIAESEAVIIGIGSEFGVKISEVIKENALYDAYMKIYKDESLDDTTKQYILHSIYYHELQSDTNSVISRYKENYGRLANIIEGKNYFMVTTCTDDVIYGAGFDDEKIVSPCGSILRLQNQCECGNVQDATGIMEGAGIFEQIYDALISNDVSEVREMIPVCGKCASPMVFNTYGVKGYNENGYIVQWDKYTKWLQRTLNRKLTLLELGVDFAVPTVIRWPFEKMAMLNYKAMLYRINGKFPQLPEEVKDKGMSVNENSFEFIEKI